MKRLIIESRILRIGPPRPAHRGSSGIDSNIASSQSSAATQSSSVKATRSACDSSNPQIPGRRRAGVFLLPPPECERSITGLVTEQIDRAVARPVIHDNDLEGVGVQSLSFQRLEAECQL